MSTIHGFAAAERAWENKDDEAPDEGLWIVECSKCGWQDAVRDKWRAEAEANGHQTNTGHDTTLTLEDR